MVRRCLWPVAVVWFVAGVGSPAAVAESHVVRMIAATFKIANKDSTATCFLVARAAVSKGGPPPTALVTAAHVLDKTSGEECQLILRQAMDDGTFARREVAIKVRREGKPLWTKHPEADVAAMRLDLPGDAPLRAVPLECLASEEAIRQGRLESGGDVRLLCYPAQIEANGAGVPVVRRGIVASFPLTPMRAHRVFLIDANTFGGDSGAPVFVAGEADQAGSGTKGRLPLIVGLVVGQHLQEERVKLVYEERVLQHRLGLAIVVPAEFIRQTIELLPP